MVTDHSSGFHSNSHDECGQRIIAIKSISRSIIHEMNLQIGLN